MAYEKNLDNLVGILGWCRGNPDLLDHDERTGLASVLVRIAAPAGDDEVMVPVEELSAEDADALWSVLDGIVEHHQLQPQQQGPQ